jgi:hypothetical protein
LNSEGHAPGGDLEDWKARDLFVSVLFPHFMMGIQGNSLLWYQIFLNDVGNMDLKIHVCAPRSARDDPEWETNADGMGALVDVIHQEDVTANDLVWKGRNSPLSKQGRLSPLEKSIWQMNQWWADKMLAAD